MRFDATVLYEQFVAARLWAVELTDSYRQTPNDDPSRGLIWDDVMRQTEVARGLLESWLLVDCDDTPAAVNAVDVGR